MWFGVIFMILGDISIHLFLTDARNYEVRPTLVTLWGLMWWKLVWFMLV